MSLNSKVSLNKIVFSLDTASDYIGSILTAFLWLFRPVNGFWSKSFKFRFRHM